MEQENSETVTKNAPNSPTCRMENRRNTGPFKRPANIETLMFQSSEDSWSSFMHLNELLHYGLTCK